ncbi:MAG: hypothetical protein MJ246_08370 [Clostridia bacterium]|nr:hypothetical protein [Clostridia bacterium]
MKINTNISSLKVLNNMQKNDTMLNRSIERLSSGLKINHAKDDASGLAISRKMQVQIDALSKASDNAGDGISLIQTAEGALNEVHSILQRQRELAVQAANGTLSEEDRAAVQSEMKMLNDEVNRISSSIQFNNMNLLDGSADLKTYPSNPDIARTLLTNEVDAGIYTFDVIQKGTQTNVSGDSISSTLVSGTGKDARLAISGIIFINNQEVDLKNTMTPDEAYEEIRRVAELSDITFTSSTGTIEGNAKLIFEHNIAGEKDIKLAGEPTLLSMLGLDNLNYDKVDIKHNELAATDLATDITAHQGKTLLVNGTKLEITDDMTTLKDVYDKLAEMDVTGIAIEKNDDGSYLFEASIFETTSDDAALKSLFDTTGTITSLAAETRLMSGARGRNVMVSNLVFDDPTSATVVGFPSGTSVQTEGNKITFNGPEGFELVAVNGGATGECKMVITNKGAIDLQIGGNEGQTMTVRIPNMSVEALGLDELNLQTAATSELSIAMLDEAIARVSEVRSKLGAFQNRLDYTVNSLNATEENLTEALSRIQDTDMAEEMTNYTQYGILSEASISILTQANQRPEGILQLLQSM